MTQAREAAPPSRAHSPAHPASTALVGGSRAKTERAALRGLSYDEGAERLAPASGPTSGPPGSPTGMQMKTTLSSGGAGSGHGLDAATWNSDDKVVTSGQSGGGYDFDDLDTRLGKLDPREGFAGAQAGVDSGGKGKGMFTEDHVGSHESGGGAGVYAGVGGKAAGFVKGFDSPAAWLSGERAGIGGGADAKAGVGGSASTNAYAEGGPALGSVDPDTGVRHGMASAEAGAGVEGYVGAKASGAGEAYVEGLGAGVAGRGSVEAGGAASAKGAAKAGVELGGWNLAGVGAQGSAGATYGVKGEASGEAQVGLGTTLAAAKGSVAAGASLRGEAQGSASGSLGGLNGRGEASGSVEVTGGASASGEVAVGPASLGARGEAEIFAGVRASGSVGVAAGALGCDLFSLSASGSIAAGVGAGAGGGLMLKDGVLFIDAELMATAGVGGSLGVSCSLDLLFPFHVLFKMLAANGVLSARPEDHISEIFGYILGQKQVKGAAHKDDEDSGDKATGLIRRTVGAGASSGDAAIYDAFESAGAKVDRQAGTIDTRSPDVDPMALVGALPGDTGKRYDAAVGAAGETIGDGQAAAAAAPHDLSGGMAGAVQSAFGGIVDLVNGAIRICKGTMEAVQALITSGVAGAIEKGKALMAAAWDTARAAIEAASNWFMRLFAWIGSLFTGFDQKKGATAASLFGDIGTVFQTVGALASGNQALLGTLAPQLSQISARLSGDGGAFADKAAQKADTARASVVALHDKPLDLGTFAGKMAISERGKQDYAQVSSLLRDNGGQAADTTGNQLASLPDKLGTLSGQSAQSANTAAQKGTGDMRTKVDSATSEADVVARTGKASSTSDATAAEAATKKQVSAA